MPADGTRIRACVAAQDREHRVAVRRVDVGVRLLLLLLRRVELRDLRGDRGQQTDGERRRAQQPEDDEKGEESELADPPAARPACVSPKERQNRGSLAPLMSLELLTRNAVDVLPAGGLEQKLKLGRPLRVKLGIDVTSPDIHIGRAIPLQRMRAFQDEGHTGVLIVGDYTTRIGDPSGRSAERPVLTDEEIDAEREDLPRSGDGDPRSRRAPRFGSTASGSPSSPMPTSCGWRGRSRWRASSSATTSRSG